MDARPASSSFRQDHTCCVFELFHNGLVRALLLPLLVLLPTDAAVTVEVDSKLLRASQPPSQNQQ
jgi:hypothetical protein